MEIIESILDTMNHVNDRAIVVETRENRLSKIFDEELECSIFVINSNEYKELKIVIEALSLYFEDISKDELKGWKVIFYMKINEESIQMFEDFEEIYGIDVIISKNHQTH